MAEIDFKKIQSYTLFAALIGVSLTFLWMLRAYAYPIFWAAVLAAVFYPMVDKLERLLKRRALAAAITELVIVILFVTPLAIIVILLIQQVVTLYSTYANQATIDQITAIVQQIFTWGPLEKLSARVDLSAQIANIGNAISEVVYGFITASGQNTGNAIIQFFIMLYTLFFFLKDGDRFLHQLMHFLPLGDTYEQRLYDRFVSTTRATLKGTILIGMVQGSIGALAFLAAGVPGTALWWLLMIMFAMIPGIGAPIVIFPVGIALFLFGNTTGAILVVIVGLIVGIVDNLIRGPLVGKDAQMHPLLILFSTLGGLVTFGFSGIVMGPVITAFMLSIWQIYEEKYRRHLVNQG